MKKTTTALKPFLSGALLVSSLALLSGCDWFKQSDCPSCDHHASATAAPSADDVLLEINGKPAVTKQKFDEFYDSVLASDPQSGFTPGIAQKIFAYLEQAALMDASIKKDKKDLDPEYKKKLEQAFELARIPVNAEFFQQEIINTIDVSDAALEAFYAEQLDKNPTLGRPPFMTKAGGIKVDAIEFNDDKSAKEFLNKVQKPGADFAALAKADNKKVQDLGVVSAQSRADMAVIAKAKDLQPNAIEKVNLSNGKFMVIKGVGARQNPESVSFADIVADENLKGYLKQIKQSAEIQPLMMKKFDDIKKDLNVVPNMKYVEEKDANQNAEFEAMIKSMKGLQEEGEKANVSKKQAKAESPKSM